MSREDRQRLEERTVADDIPEIEEAVRRLLAVPGHPEEDEGRDG